MWARAHLAYHDHMCQSRKDFKYYTCLEKNKNKSMILYIYKIVGCLVSILMAFWKDERKEKLKLLHYFNIFHSWGLN